MAVEWIGKFREDADGNREPVAYIVGVPCKDLDDDELREIARTEGTRRDVLERRLRDSGLFRITKAAPEEPEEPDEPEQEDTGFSPLVAGFEPVEDEEG